MHPLCALIFIVLSVTIRSSSLNPSRLAVKDEDGFNKPEPSTGSKGVCTAIDNPEGEELVSGEVSVEVGACEVPSTLTSAMVISVVEASSSFSVFGDDDPLNCDAALLTDSRGPWMIEGKINEVICS